MTKENVGALFGFALLTVLAGCATPATQRVSVDDATLAAEQRKQHELAAKDAIHDRDRLYRVGYALERGAVDFCSDKVGYRTGMMVNNAPQVRRGIRNEGTRNAWISVLHLGDPVQVTTVVPGSSAARAGIQAGDQLVTINDWSVPEGSSAPTETARKLRELAGPSPHALSLGVRRGGRLVKVQVQTEATCIYPILIQQSETLNAFANGKAVFITRRMMEFARSDDELAIVVGHELAHNFMGHLEAQSTNATMGGIGGLLVDLLFAAGGVNTSGQFTKTGMNIGRGAFSQDFEAEADYAGLYVTARAGYKIAVAPDLWRRMAMRNTGAIDFATTHPTTAYRASALEKVVSEISDKKAKGLPLVPNLKPRPKVEIESSSPDSPGD